MVFGPPTLPAAYPRWSETLRDRSHVLIRPLSRRDRAIERAFFDGLSPQSRRFRCFGQVGHPDERPPAPPAEGEYARTVAFAAVVPEGAGEKIVGSSRYASDEQGLRCLCEVVVDDDWQHKGLGTLLMRHLIEVARGDGIRTMTAIDSAENVALSDLAAFLGFRSRVDPRDPERLIHELRM